MSVTLKLIKTLRIRKACISDDMTNDQYDQLKKGLPTEVSENAAAMLLQCGLATAVDNPKPIKINKTQKENE